MNERIVLEHGAGGELTDRLINKIFISAYRSSEKLGKKTDYFIRNADKNTVISETEFTISENISGDYRKFSKIKTDSAVLAAGKSLISFTTDSYVIKPLFFPGGDIGKLSVCGTVNDLAVSGSIPEYISVSFVIEEGFPINDLKKIIRSQTRAAIEAGVEIVCGDTKVVEKGSCDGVFICTSGIGILDKSFKGISTAEGINEGDVIIVSGNIGRHGTAVLAARENLPFSKDIISDCAPLSGMIQDLLKEVPDIIFMRDATRGGLATVLSELAEIAGTGIQIDEVKIPVDSHVKAVTDILGLDPMYLANEGTIIIAAKKGTEHKVISILNKSSYGQNCTVIGKTVNIHPGKAVLKTAIGGKRFINKLTGFQLPRIC